MASDVEIDRAIGTLVTTLNDQRLEEFDEARLQEIVTGALGEEPLLHVRRNPGTESSGWLADPDGRQVASIELRDGEWTVDRDASAGPPPPR